MPKSSPQLEAIMDANLAFIDRFTSALVQRVASKGVDQAPIVIRSGSREFGIVHKIPTICAVCEFQPVILDLTGSHPGCSRVEDFKKLPKSNLPDAIDKRVVILIGWETAPEVAATNLKTLLPELLADKNCVVVIYGIGNPDSDFDYNVGEVIGNELWREMTYIQHDLPPIAEPVD